MGRLSKNTALGATATKNMHAGMSDMTIASNLRVKSNRHGSAVGPNELSWAQSPLAVMDGILQQRGLGVVCRSVI